MSDISLTCQCGSTQGIARHITPASGNRIVCCCSDCQAFANYLGADTDTLDVHGGTEIYQTSQSQIQITHGQENLQSLRLTSKGLLRWYASCCNTPIGNCISAGVPFFGIIHSFTNIEDREATLGAVRAYCQTQDAIGVPDHPKAHPKFSLGITCRMLRQLLIWKIQGKHRPSSFFHTDGQPAAKPIIVNQVN